MSLKKFIRAIEILTEFVHILFGVLAALIIHFYFPRADFFQIIIITTVFSLFPDIDHLFSIFIYSRKKEYSEKFRGLFFKKNFKELFWLMINEHKDLTWIYSHNLITFILTAVLARYFILVRKAPYVSALFLSWTFHYLWDMLEDLVIFGNLNPNWYLRFNKKNKRNEKTL